MIRPSEVSYFLTDIVAGATDSRGIWKPVPLTEQQFAQIRKETWAYFDSLRARFEQEKEKVNVGS